MPANAELFLCFVSVAQHVVTLESRLPRIFTAKVTTVFCIPLSDFRHKACGVITGYKYDIKLRYRTMLTINIDRNSVAIFVLMCT